MEMKNNMMCDLETGVCGPAGEENTNTMEFIDFSAPKKKIDLYYVTDPICSHCWALEPVLRKFFDRYGQYFNMHTLMGGLLENWDGFADVSNGISSPGDVAVHWKEVGDHSRMPIDGTLWYDNPIESSYIPSRVYKVIQEISQKLANTFLRRAREELFAFNKNIAQDDLLIELYQSSRELTVKKSLNNRNYQKPILHYARTSSRFEIGRSWFSDNRYGEQRTKGVKIVGARTIEDYTNALQQMLPQEILNPRKVSKFRTVTSKRKVVIFT